MNRRQRDKLFCEIVQRRVQSAIDTNWGKMCIHKRDFQRNAQQVYMHVQRRRYARINAHRFQEGAVLTLQYATEQYALEVMQQGNEFSAGMALMKGTPERKTTLCAKHLRQAARVVKRRDARARQAARRHVLVLKSPLVRK